jgi:signal transduction histidine kinase
VERTLADVSTRLVKSTDPRLILPDVIRDVAEMVDAQRVALVFLNMGEGTVDDIYEWHAPHRPPLEPPSLSGLITIFPWVRGQLQEGHPVFLEDLAQMPVSAAAERKILHGMGADSIALFPVHVEGVLAAVLVCSNFAKKETKASRRFDILNVVSDLLETLLQREALLDSLEGRAIDRSRELAAFYDMTMLAGEAENVSDILKPALIHIMTVVNCQAVSIHELSATNRRALQLVAQHGLDQENGVQLEVPLDGLSDWFESLNEPIVENNLVESTRLPLALRPAGYAVYLGAQLRARGRSLGILSCYRQIDRPYSLNATALAVALAEQLGIIIENYRLRQKAEQGVIIEERQRLARDLHDAITQSLYGVTLFARSAADALEEGSLERAAETLPEIEQNALFALKEMRLLLHQLQPLALEQGGLRPAIDSRLNQVERRLGIKAALAISDGLLLRPRAKEAVYRIITEALNNCLKHAGASEVSVILRENQDAIRLEVNDNGCGFDPAAPSSGMGLKNIRERATLLGGKLAIASAPEAGTSISVDLPLEWLE